MIKGKTKSGFSYELDKERLNNYELLEAIEELEENPLVLSRVVNLLLGKEQTKKLKDHLNFNPRTHEECDLMKGKKATYLDVFQSTHSRGVRHVASLTVAQDCRISIHALTRSAT